MLDETGKNYKIIHYNNNKNPKCMSRNKKKVNKETKLKIIAVFLFVFSNVAQLLLLLVVEVVLSCTSLCAWKSKKILK